MQVFVKSKTKDKDQECFQFLEEFNIRCALRIFLGPLFFNIYLIDLILGLKDVGKHNLANNTTTYISDESLENALTSLEKNSMLAMRYT